MAKKSEFHVTFESNLPEVKRASAEAIERGLAAIGMRAVTYTHRPKEQGGTPVDTGRLRNSIAWATQNQSGGGDDATSNGGADTNTVVIGTNVEYGQIIEEGSARRSAAHMLRNALTDGADEYKKIMQAALEAGN